jgi:hypothetical protein
MFLEVYLGTGVIGFLAFVFFWFGLGGKLLYAGVKQLSPLAVILVPLWISLSVFNLFNSGLFLGFLFVCMAFFLISPTHEHA